MCPVWPGPGPHNGTLYTESRAICQPLLHPVSSGDETQCNIQPEGNRVQANTRSLPGELEIHHIEWYSWYSFLWGRRKAGWDVTPSLSRHLLVCERKSPAWHPLTRWRYDLSPFVDFKLSALICDQGTDSLPCFLDRKRLPGLSGRALGHILC